LGGRTAIQTDVIIRGDLLRTPGTASTSAGGQASGGPSLAVSVGKYSVLAPQSILHPPSKLHRGVFSHHPLKIGENVYVGPGAIIEAATIGNNVWIGPRAVIGKLAILRDGCRVLEDTVVPPSMMVGAGDVVAGKPARRVGDVGWSEGWEGREMWRSIG
jgi:dynactin 5